MDNATDVPEVRCYRCGSPAHSEHEHDECEAIRTANSPHVEVEAYYSYGSGTEYFGLSDEYAELAAKVKQAGLETS